MTRFIRLGSALMTAGIAACASSGSHSPSAGAGPAHPPHWEGSFRISQMAATAVIGPGQTGHAAGYGTIKLTPVAGPTPVVQAEVTVSAPVTAGTQLAWAVFSGPCGTMSGPVIGQMQFPTISIANSGNGFVRANLPIAMDAHATYHANVYWSSQATDVSNVMMCANVELSDR